MNLIVKITDGNYFLKMKKENIIMILNS